MKSMNTRALVTTAMLIAFEIILTRFLSIQTPIVRIGFGFLPIAIIAALYGPLYAGIAAAAADLIGVMLFPAGAFFPGFTLTAFLTGVIYGVFIHNNPKSILRITLAVVIIVLFLDLGLNTLWIQIITGNAYLVLLPPRIMKALVMIPIQIILIRMFVGEMLRLLTARA